MSVYTPRRIVCLTTETTEVLYLLGMQDKIVGISGYTTRPANARRDKPKVSAFSTANIEKILALAPDLVLTCTDLQADIAATLIRAGIQVHAFNQRTIAGIFTMIATLGAMVDSTEAATQLIAELERKIAQAKAAAEFLPAKPCIYFEEWNDPMISGINWVSELISIAGGEDCFPELATQSSAKNRVIQNPQWVIDRAPDIIIGSWCGKRFQPEQVMARPGWHTIPAIANGDLHEIKSADILQPGPSVITHGLVQLQAIIHRWGSQHAHKKHWS